MSTIRLLNSDNEIVYFTVNKLPSKRLTNIKVIRHGDTIMGVSTSGKLYGISGVPVGAYSYVGWTWNWLVDFAEILKILGLISDEDCNATINKSREERRVQDMKCTAKSVSNDLERLGIKLTKTQLKKINDIKEMKS